MSAASCVGWGANVECCLPPGSPHVARLSGLPTRGRQIRAMTFAALYLFGTAYRRARLSGGQVRAMS